MRYGSAGLGHQPEQLAWAGTVRAKVLTYVRAGGLTVAEIAKRLELTAARIRHTLWNLRKFYGLKIGATKSGAVTLG